MLELAFQLGPAGRGMLLQRLETAARALDEMVAVQHVTQVCQAHICVLQAQKCCLGSAGT